MRSKLLFFDIDGTLVEEENFNIPLSAITAIKKVQANGHTCFINTGRPIGVIESELKNLDFDGYICACGTYVEYKNRIISYTSIPRSNCFNLIKILCECRMNAVLESRDNIFFPTDRNHPTVEGFYQYYINQGFNPKLYSKDTEVEFEKIACWFNEDGDIGRVRDYVLSIGLKIIERGKDFIEIIPSNCSKASGIKTIVEYLDIPLDDTISFGDSNNDLEMFEITNQSIAMGNADFALKEKATYITTNINDNGIFNALDYLELL